MGSRDGVLWVLAMVAAAGCGNDGSTAGSPAATSTTVAGAGGSATGSAGSAGSTVASGTGGTAGSTGSGGSGGGAATDLPASDSAADIGTFLKAGGYKLAPWVSDVAAPRAGASGTQHGDNVRVWLNKAAVDALKAGHTGITPAPPVDQGSMVVKEMYDDASALAGLAVSFKTAAGTAPSGWTYYCYGPDPRCLGGMTGTEAMPIYNKGDKGAGQQCGLCHGYSIYTKPPM